MDVQAKRKKGQINFAPELEKLGAVQNDLDVRDVEVMKPETRERPFSHPAWIFELKYDGFRALAGRRGGEARIEYRSGRDATVTFPEVARAVAALPFDLILDGEIVVLDASGRPSFQDLQRRGQRTRRIDCEHAAAATPATFFVFDLLALEGYDLRPLPLAKRKDLLRRVLAASRAAEQIRRIDEVPERGEDLYAAVAELGLEGIVGKRADAPYRAGYSADWVKVRVDQTADFAVLGFEPVPRSRSGLRCLHLGVREGAGWAYVGTVGTGFSNQETTEIRARLEPARRPQPVLPGKPPGDRSAVWVEPELVCEVRFKERTRGGHLRQPVFLRLRDDKTVEECLPPPPPTPPPHGHQPPTPSGRGEPTPDRALREGSRDALSRVAAPLSRSGRKSGGRTGEGSGEGVSLTNLDKVFWPDEGYTKGDLIEHYRAVAPWLLPYLKDRPLVLDRYPNGITGKSFFQKNAPELAPSWLRTIAIGSIDYFLCDTAEALLYLANLGTIPLHIWSSRLTSLDRPDWCILDLDPKGAPFEHVVRIALEIRSLCEEIELESFVKTSGGSGIHVLLPLGGQLEHDATRQLGELLARVIVDRLPEIATTARAIPARRGRVYIDALQNGRGKLLAAPYSVRPRPGATVSTPLSWSEVGPRLDIGSFTIRTVPQRLKKRKDDPLLPVLERVPDLARSLSLLADRV